MSSGSESRPFGVGPAANLGESSIVALGKGADDQLRRLLAVLDPVIIPVDAARCDAMRAAYERWGKSIHPARLNIFDCFAYALARERGLPLLYIGEGFAKTDIASEL